MKVKELLTRKTCCDECGQIIDPEANGGIHVQFNTIDGDELLFWCSVRCSLGL